jgi:hypothetical protein
MTKAKAASISSALVNADFIVQVIRRGTNDYAVRVTSVDGQFVNIDQIKTFADAQSVSAAVGSAMLS